MPDAPEGDLGSPPPLTDMTGRGADEEATRAYRRSPEDVLRLLVFAATTIVLVAVVVWIEDAASGFERDLVALFDVLTPTVERIVTGLAELVVVLSTLAVYATAIISKRYRLLGCAVAATTTSLVVMSVTTAAIDHSTAAELRAALVERSGWSGGAPTGVVGLAQLAGLFVVAGPFVPHRWHRAGWSVIGFVTLTRLVVIAHPPVEVFVALPLGATCGAAVLVAFGRPDRRPTRAALAAALGASGIVATRIDHADVGGRGSIPYTAVRDGGDVVFVKELGADERAADLMTRTYRLARFKDVGDARPFSSLRRTVEHEALVALLARDAGVRTPRLCALGEVGSDSMFLAYDFVEGRTLDDVDDVSDELLAAIWGEVSSLRRQRIAHRDLRAENVLVDASGTPWLVGFGVAEVAQPDGQLDIDVANMLATLASVVGSDRAVSSAIDALGAGPVGAALPRLQRAALRGRTVTALKSGDGLAALQRTVIEQTGVADVAYVPLERVSGRTLFTAAMLVAVTYFLVPQLADLPGIVEQVRDANWAWAPLVLVGSAITYVAASIGLAGSVPDRLPSGPLVLAALASEFASKLAPAGIGGMALNLRFLQKQGVDEPVAVSGVGLNTVAGVIGHVSLIGVFLVWAGRDAFGSFELPNPTWLLVAVGAGVVALAASALIGPVRRMFLERMWPMVRRSLDGVTAVFRRPGKVLMLLGGSILLTMAYLVTLYFSVAAFGGGLAFATVGAVYLVASAVAQAAPTPGGLGAVEAALIAGLVAAGLGNTVAVPAVFMFRLFTFWVPILPGWISFQWLQRRDYL
jgi:uncharacterized protein (TIRG00374 family)